MPRSQDIGEHVELLAWNHWLAVQRRPSGRLAGSVSIQADAVGTASSSDRQRGNLWTIERVVGFWV